MITYGQVVDRQLVVDTLNEIFGDGKFDLDFVKWLDGCPTGTNRWFAAFSADRIVGLYGLLPLVVHIGGKHHTAALCNNVGVVPDFRGKHIFTTLGKYALDNMWAEVAIGVPNEAAVPGHMKVGWKSVGKLVMMRGELPEKKSPWYYLIDDFCYMRSGVTAHFHIVRGKAFAMWRYRKPGQEYRQTLLGPGRYVIWKKYDGRRQMMETDAATFGPALGGAVDMWCFEGSKAHKRLIRRGFDPVLEREFILHTDVKVKRNINKFWFEACDWDIL